MKLSISSLNPYAKAVIAAVLAFATALGGAAVPTAPITLMQFVIAGGAALIAGTAAWSVANEVAKAAVATAGSVLAALVTAGGGPGSFTPSQWVVIALGAALTFATNLGVDNSPSPSAELQLAQGAATLDHLRAQADFAAAEAHARMSMTGTLKPDPAPPAAPLPSYATPAQFPGADTGQQA